MRFERDEEQVEEFLGYEDLIGSAHTEGAPDLLDAVARENQDPARQPITEIGTLFSPPLREGEVEEPDQFRAQPRYSRIAATALSRRRSSPSGNSSSDACREAK